MDIDLLKQVNSLWRKIYPYLALQIMTTYRKHSGSVLELGPFAGGISLELAKLYSGFKVTIAAESSEVVEYLKKEIAASGLSQDIEIKKTDLDHLVFDDAQFDLVIFRGAFFFLDQKGNILREIFRVLKEGGRGFVGGGYGKDIPPELIDEIADESRELNNRLGRKRISITELEEVIKKSQLTDKCKIEIEGGLWLVVKK